MVCIEEPAPELLRLQDLAMPVDDFDRIAKKWLAQIGGTELYGLSLEETELVLESGDGVLLQHRIVLDVLQGIRKSLCSYEREGFAGMLNDFNRLTRTQSGKQQTRQDFLAAFQREAGGVLFRPSGKPWHLLLPTQQGVWGVCDGARLVKREENPFR